MTTGRAVAVHLSNSAVPSRAANTVQSLMMMDALAQAGFDVHGIARRGAGDVSRLAADYGLVSDPMLHLIQPTGPKGTRTADVLVQVRRAVAELEPIDLLFARDPVSLAAVRRTGIPTILELHRTTVDDRLGDAAMRRLIKDSDVRLIVVVSEGMADFYRDRYPGLTNDRLAVFPGAASPPPKHEPDREIPHRAGVPQVGYVGQLYEGRGVPLLIELAERMADVDVHLVGGDPQSVQRWQNRTVAPNIHFHGFVNRSSLGQFYDLFDVVLAPYEQTVHVAGGAETSAVMSPLKLFEYMSTTTPMVSSNHQVIREVLEHEETALLVPPGDADAWEVAVRRLVGDATVANTLAANAYESYRTNHTWTARIDAILARAAVESPGRSDHATRAGLDNYPTMSSDTRRKEHMRHGGLPTHQWLSTEGLRTWRADPKDRRARLWSNGVIEQVAAGVTGMVVNVSAFRDEDKAGRRYRSYFSKCASYDCSNWGGLVSDDATTTIWLDLEEPVPEEHVGGFDFVLNHTTLEHIFDVNTAMDTLAALTTDALLVVVPFSQREHGQDYGDFWRFTRAGLVRSFESRGLHEVFTAQSPFRYSAVYLASLFSRKPDSWSTFADRYPSPAKVGQFVGRGSGLRRAYASAASQMRARR